MTTNQTQVADAAEASGYGSDVFDAVVVQNAAGAAQTGSPAEALRLGRRWLSHLEALLKG